jgi:hypothetical protein
VVGRSKHHPHGHRNQGGRQNGPGDESFAHQAKSVGRSSIYRALQPATIL